MIISVKFELPGFRVRDVVVADTRQYAVEDFVIKHQLLGAPWNCFFTKTEADSDYVRYERTPS